MDEAYVRAVGERRPLFHVVDKRGQLIALTLSDRRLWDLLQLTGALVPAQAAEPVEPENPALTDEE
ncbi:hypothetical protein [Microvirga flocculans]|uniref:hypothetical protein n=1 Tax=Microvirga flocculans TaxID=217168 RepID=UPI0013773198